MRFVAYDDQYKEGVISCLKRNYAWMSELSDEQVYIWLTPVINYSWIGEFDCHLFPYVRGIVLLDDSDTVRGFSAVIHSKQSINESKKIVVSPSTTAIDGEYRYCFFEMCEEIYKYADIGYDFSPSEAVRIISRDRFGFEIIDNPTYMMLPFFSRTKGLNIDNEIKDENTKQILRDHIDYGIKCCHLFSSKEETYVFYKIIKKIKRLPIRTLCVIHITNPKMFTNHFKQCVSLLSRKEHSCFMADSRYVDVNQLPKHFVKKQKYRAIHNPCGSSDYTFLYSELALLQNEMV